MEKKCSKCPKSAVTFIRYNGTWLCKTHFLQYVEKRVKKEIKQQGKTQSPATFGVAISGGKDSNVALYLIHKIFGRRPGISIHAITVDEGIQGYRNHSIPVAAGLCKQLDIPHTIVSFQDTIECSMDAIAQKNMGLGECTFCGVFRRFCLNTVAKNLKVSKLVTGHNLDDMSQSILMNFVNGDVEKLARLGPHTKIQKGLIPRMIPLRVIPEKEIMLYALLRGIPFHNAECPYAVHASRGVYRDIIADIEDRNPGTRHSIVNSYDNMKELLLKKYPPAELNVCHNCGEPTSQDLCKTCVLRAQLQG